MISLSVNTRMSVSLLSTFLLHHLVLAHSSIRRPAHSTAKERMLYCQPFAGRWVLDGWGGGGVRMRSMIAQIKKCMSKQKENIKSDFWWTPRQRGRGGGHSKGLITVTEHCCLLQSSKLQVPGGQKSVTMATTPVQLLISPSLCLRALCSKQAPIWQLTRPTSAYRSFSENSCGES